MESTVTAVAVVVALSLWHLRNRRHPGWRASEIGRFFVHSGYPLVAIAAWWLVTAPTATSWEWALGNVWALAAMVSFVYGFTALHQVTVSHAQRSQHFETLQGVTALD